MDSLIMSMDIIIGFIAIASMCFAVLFFIFSFIYRTHLTNNSAISLGLISLLVSVWLFSEVFRSLPATPLEVTNLPLFIALDLSIFLATTYIPFVFLIFAWEFPDVRISRRTVYSAFIFHSLLIAFQLWSIAQNTFIEDIFNQIFLIVLLGYVLFALILLIRRIPRHSSPIKEQLIFLCAGLGLSLGGSIITIFINNIINSDLLAFIPEILAFLFILNTSYIVISYNLFSFPPLLTKLLLTFALFLGTLYFQITLFLLGQTSRLALVTTSSSIFSVLFVFLVYILIKQIETKRVLKRKQAKLKTLAQEKDRFLRISSHQLRTPLTALEGYISLVKEETHQSPAETKHIVNTLDLLITRMQSLVQQLLSFNSLQTGTFEITQRQPIDVYNLLTEIKHTETAIEDIDDSVHFSMYGKENEYVIRGDRPKLKAALSNIVHNALTYTENLVTITLSHTNSNLEIYIEDNGIGITDSEQNILFEQFERGEKAAQRNPDGSGLGLYLAKQIIELHEGTISFDSKGRGKGTTVHISLPFSQ